MIDPNLKKHWKKFYLRIILPTLLTITLFIISIFVIIIPMFKATMLERKREIIRELTHAAWSILLEYENERLSGKLSLLQAQNAAKHRIEFLRYGKENKDYFWINDTRPVMIMHPYLKELDGRDLSDYSDPRGKKLFMESVKILENSDEGFLDYMWQWKDDPGRIVPKLSYVKIFRPWNWIIGTGIYIEDVKEEISHITLRLINSSVIITLVIMVLLFYISRQSMRIERQWLEADRGLKESEEKYRTLVEAATEGTLMILEGRYIYSNTIIQNRLGYSENDFGSMPIYDIFSDGVDDDTGLKLFKSIIHGETGPGPFEAVLRKKNGEPINSEINISKIQFGGKSGFTVIIKDISGIKEIEEELDKSREKYNILTNNLDIGVFRSTTGRKGKFIEANPAAAAILGFKTTESMVGANIMDGFRDPESRKNFLTTLSENGFVKNRILDIKRDDGTNTIISISAVLTKDEMGVVRYCDGIIEDITEQKKKDDEREKLIIELQTSLLFLNQPIRDLIKENIECDMNMPILKTASIMTKNNFSAALVNTPTGECIGIVTDHDLRERIIAGNRPVSTPVYEIMSSPLVSINENAMIFEAILLMNEKNINHLAVRDNNGKIISAISNNDILQVHRFSSAFLLREINGAESIDEIIESHGRLPRLVKALIDSGARSKNITRIITGVSDAITEKLIRFAIDELGEPPVKFAFLELGSCGREEQTLATDQDNAILFEDGDDPDGSVEQYFLELGEKVCAWLNEIGYNFCSGDVMARNPKWCKPVSTWKDYFSGWINTANPQDLLEVNIFFDYRCIFGSRELTDELDSFIDGAVQGKAPFFFRLAENTLMYKPPIGFFGNIVVESSGENQETFSIKEALKPIQNFARIYSIQKGIHVTNTLDRINRLYELNVIKKSMHEEITQAYNYLMLMRFKHQVLSVNNNLEPDNNINPKKLTQIEHAMLKKILSEISTFQSKLSYDFTGTM